MIPAVANGVLITLVPPPGSSLPPRTAVLDPNPLTVLILFNGFPIVVYPGTVGGVAIVAAAPVTTVLFNGLPAIGVGSAITLSDGYTATIPATAGAGPTVNVS